jgi:hypothetical protein
MSMAQSECREQFAVAHSDGVIQLWELEGTRLTSGWSKQLDKVKPCNVAVTETGVYVINAHTASM